MTPVRLSTLRIRRLMVLVVYVAVVLNPDPDILPTLNAAKNRSLKPTTL
jgi:hypothetical protein